MTERFFHEDDIKAAYDSAEIVIRQLVADGRIIVMNNGIAPTIRDYHKMVRGVASDIADAVIRSRPEYGDISEVPGVQIERVP
jgi:hypothetical protein